MVNKKITLK